MAFRYRFISPTARAALYSPEEEDDLIGDLASAGGSLLGTIGSILDTPGRFIRTGLAGENPFASILDPDRGVSGRELLERGGLLGPNEKGFDFGDVLGFGTEIVTDPLTLVGGGTTKAGSIAKSLGKFPKRSLFDVGTGALSVGKRTARRGTLGSVLEGASDDVMRHAAELAEKQGSRLDDLLAEPMQKSIGFGLPFKDNFATFDLPGAAGRAKALDYLGGKARMSWPGREAARLFDRTVRNASGGKVQEVAKNFTEEFEPLAAEAEAQALARNDALLAAGVSDPDIRRNLAEGFHESAWGEQLAPDEAVRRNLPQLDGEDLPSYEARTKPIADILKKSRSEGDKLFDRRVELGLTNPLRRHETNYSSRGLTRPEPGKSEVPSTNWEMGRTDIGDIPTTPVNQALEDADFVALAQNIEVDPLSAEVLKRRVPEQINQYLENVGYDDLEDLVDWQARGMLGADPKRAGMNANAAMRTAIGMRDAPELTRTVLPPRPEIDADALNSARAYVLDKHLGVPKEQFEQMDAWLGEAKALPSLKKEWEELADTARQSDYNPSLPEQELAYQGKLGEAEAAREAYLAGKARLDSREIFSRERPDEWFDAERMTQEEVLALENTQRRAGLANYARQQEYAKTLAEAAEFRKEADRLRRTTAKGEMSVLDANRNFTVGKAVKAIRKQEATIAELETKAANSERWAESLKRTLDDGEAAKTELGALEADFRQRGYFQQGDAQLLKDDELRQLAALRNQADEAGKWRGKLKRVQERLARGERQLFPAEHLDELQDQIGRAEVAKSNLAAMKLKVDMADAVIKHAKKYGVGRTFNNDVLVDDLSKKIHDTRRIAWAENAQDALARNATMQPQEGVEYIPITEALRKAGAAGLDATSMAQAIKRTIGISKEAGTIDAKIADNIAGPHAVATSGVVSDAELAQAMRTRELLATRDSMLAAGANQSEIAAKMAEIGRMPLPDTSAAGNVMRVKQAYADVALSSADQSLAAGLIDKDGHAAVKAEIDKWLKSDKFVPGETAQQMLGPDAMQIVSAARAANPIANDGLLAMKNILVPKEFVDQLVSARSLWEQPSQEKTIGSVIDAIRQVTKAHLTLPHAGFHGRNLQGSAALFATLRAFDPTTKGLKGLVQPIFDMWGVLRGKGIRDAENFPQVKALGLKGKDAERWVLSQLSAKGGLRGAGDTLSEGIEPTFVGDIRRSVKGGESAEQLARNVPGNAPIDAKYFYEPFTKREGVNRLDPRKPEQFFATATGARVSNFTENLLRGGAMIGLMRQGKTVDEAAALMKAAFVDYSNLTKWERTFARRVIPFYSWLRHASVFAAKNLMEQPAGFNAQLARLARVSQQDAGFLPPQMGGSLAIPIGQEEDGTQRYLSQMDFPVETLNKLVQGAGGGKGAVQNTLRSLVAQTDPILKGLLEQAFGQSSFRGRNLDDLESTTGRLAANLTGAEDPLWKAGWWDSVLANSPLSRYAGTATQAGDDRKGWGTFGLNTITGLKISDVDMDKARKTAASQAAKDLLKQMGAPTVSTIRFSKDDLEKLSPEEKERAKRMQALLNAMTRERKKEKKK